MHALPDNLPSGLVGFSKQNQELIATVPDHTIGAAHAGL